ncbi:MAG: biopolymer transporter ExbD [Acidobacteria bacterium RIFCSPLOWO2_12_FULL_54_10]|nr:MAG: biopolymer transporter ExbD [Acidobacteria bacterium RIFCSPLOWO2_12_FULL_54_10]
MAFKKELGDVSSEPNVVPMADVMLVLLIIFMVVTPMLQKGVSVEMAPAVNARAMSDADKDDAVVVAVSRDGKIFLSKDQVALSELSQNVREMITDRLDKTVYIKSDGRAKYEQVVKAVNEVRSAGVDKLGLITEKVRPEDRARMMMTP